MEEEDPWDEEEMSVTTEDPRVDAEHADATVLAEGTLRDLWASALCRTVAQDDERWLTDAHTVQREEDRVRIARELWTTVCSDCPVWSACLRWAVENDEVGIWAGTTQQQRRKMKRTPAGNMALDYSADADA